MKRIKYLIISLLLLSFNTYTQNDCWQVISDIKKIEKILSVVKDIKTLTEAKGYLAKNSTVVYEMKYHVGPKSSCNCVSLNFKVKDVEIAYLSLSNSKTSDNFTSEFDKLLKVMEETYKFALNCK